ncbi:MAG: efflux RND transporter periplasmic adaptor subunit [Hahellaceae bacterium]|nr:efflux RND transporter periplasmic adaptor subunit [Hahellaceae bacterium]
MRPTPRSLLTSLMSMMLLGLTLPLTASAADETGAPPPTPVTAAEVIQETIQEWQEFTGRLEAPQRVELRPRVSGYLEKVLFREGSVVKAGQTLYTIDNRAFAAEANRLEADIRSAEARLKQASSDQQRAESLRRQGAIAIEQLETRNTEVLQAQASLESLKAALVSAHLNLSFTEVTAPINGHVSDTQVTPGNYVTAGTTVLTTLVSSDQVQAYFEADESTYLRFRSTLSGGKGSNPVLMKLTNETDFSYRGYIDFVDNEVNPATGTIRLRATFENTRHTFTPGLFVRLQVVGGAPRQAILVDEKAVATDLANKYVLVVNAENTLEYRPVVLGDRMNGLRIVNQGLSAGERIVTKGLHRAFPGSAVDPALEPMAPPEVLEKLHEMQKRLAGGTS